MHDFKFEHNSHPRPRDLGDNNRGVHRPEQTFENTRPIPEGGLNRQEKTLPFNIDESGKPGGHHY